MAEVVLHALAYVLLCFGTLVGSHLLSDSQKSMQVTQISAFCFSILIDLFILQISLLTFQ